MAQQGSRGRFAVGSLLLNHGVELLTGHGVPVDGTTGAGLSGPGSTYVDVDAANAYMNTGTLASPVWTPTGGGGDALREVYNGTGGNFTANTLVALSGWDETLKLPKIVKADADAGLPADYVLPAAILDGASGLGRQTFRSAATLNTNAAAAVGDPVYLDYSTAGGWTLTAPTGATAVVQVVGRVAVKSATVGVVEFDVRPESKIGTNQLEDKAVTLAKMDDMATASLIYRKTAAAGAPEVNSLATLKTDLGLTGTNSGDQTITLTGNVTGSGNGTFAATVAADQITAAQLAVAMRTWLNAIRTYLADGLLQIGTITVSGGDDTKFKTTTEAIYTIAGLPYTKAATDNLVFSAADTINTGGAASALWGAWLVEIGVDGAVHTKPAGGLADQVYANEAAAIAALPSATVSHVQVGYFTVQGLVSTAWTANASNFTVGVGAGNCTARNFYDLPGAKTLPAAL